ncbi:porin [Wohlfahrtiimonas chitiniclastica]|uniref:porin n=1 Tax=Wohlfahrtiimonas chitiniclastica TaxID=400946 RepID=UPI001BD029F2|nr:porin [Wohlfahrtiimonas chitiniclastica]MBS7817078.1 porin [Wohlfahrtiimonas chitiniclastica]MBS7822718.1 porin [Wohlfahrtiimonas chitiniclastica]MBS7830533.1 porin [Wohlfahrtiimonas chitiniclastica]MBS7832639.1 porin [Wohlfahrtiimonas chitiniclastica]
MKKSLVVVALAGAMAFTAASAETVLYGSIRLGAEVQKNHFSEANIDGTKVAVKNKRGLQMEDFGSRLGLKGSEDLGNGMKAIYQVEWGFDGMAGGKGADYELRLAYIGLTGDWGTFALGRQNNPFTESLNAGTIADEFNGNYTSALRIATGAVFAGPETGVDNFNATVMPTRVGNSVAYVSPSFSGFNFTVAGIAEAPEGKAIDKGLGIYTADVYNAKNNKSKGFDIYTVGLNYEHESGFYAKAAYLGTDLYKDAKRGNAYGVNVGFANEQFGVNADFGAAERGRKSDTQAKISSKGWDVGAQFSFGPDYFSTVRATVGQSTTNYKYVEADKVKDKMTVWALGFEQKLSTRTKVWAEFAKENRKVKETGVTESNKRHNDVFSLGIRHDF